jgi:hypothetical protein
MALPSREFLLSEVDREFRLQHPTAPVQLDPDDPNQATLVEAWRAMFTEFLNRMVDSHFYRLFPEAPRLDPNNPEHATMIEYWTDMRDTIRDGSTPKWDWDAAERAGLEAQASAPTAPHAEHNGSATKPDLDVRIDENKLAEALKELLHGSHKLADTTELVGYLARALAASEHSVWIAMAEVAEPVGDVLLVIIAIIELVEAFGTGRRMQEQQGWSYGVMWQVCGISNQEKHFVDWFNDTAQELHDAFYEGAERGRAKGAQTEVNNAIIADIAFYRSLGQDERSAQERALNDLWVRNREDEHGRDYLIWPIPESMQAF